MRTGFQQSKDCFKSIGMELEGYKPPRSKKNERILVELLLDSSFYEEMRSLYTVGVSDERIKKARPFISDPHGCRDVHWMIACDVLLDYVKHCEMIGRPHRYVDTH